jgi:hypothetical protein
MRRIQISCSSYIGEYSHAIVHTYSQISYLAAKSRTDNSIDFTN